MEWAEWIDAMHKLGYSDTQIASYLQEQGYKKSAIRKVFGNAPKIPFFHTLFIENADEYFTRLDTSDVKAPLALLSVNAMLAGLLFSVSFSLPFYLGVVIGPVLMAVQILCAHAGSKISGGEGTLKQTLFAQALSVSAEFFIAAFGLILFIFLRPLSSLIATSVLVLFLWVAMMLSGALGYSGLEYYHEIPFAKAISSALLLPLIAIFVGVGAFMAFTFANLIYAV